MMTLYKATKADLFRLSSNECVLIKSCASEEALCCIAKIENFQDQNNLIVLLNTSSLILERLVYLKFLQITAIFQGKGSFNAKLYLAEKFDENDTVRCLLELQDDLLENDDLNFPMFLT